MKWDLLGLKTLDVIDQTIKLVKERHGVEIIADDIDVNDSGIYKVINAGFNTGIFQFESDMFASIVQKIKPSNILELSDITSLNLMGEVKVGHMLELPKAYSRILSGND